MMVDTFRLQDLPFPGFSQLTWEHESTIDGSLFDIGEDAGYTNLGIHKVSGQIWLAEDTEQIRELECFLGSPNITEPIQVQADIKTNDLIIDKMPVIVYKLREIKENYKMIHTGKWSIKRQIWK